MCGIVGNFCYDSQGPTVDLNELTLMRDALFSRGPDQSQLWISEDKKLGFGHTRLSIIDTSELGSQPMIDGDQNLVLVFNGMISNYKLLRENLKALGHRFKGSSDTEVLLNMYKEFGPEMIPKIKRNVRLCNLEQ